MAVNNPNTRNVAVPVLPRSKERGVALLEAVLIIPVLLLFIGGSIDLGTLIVRYVSAARLSYEAARYGAQVAGTTPTNTAMACPAEGNAAFAESDQGSSQNSMMSGVCSRIKALMEGTNFNYNNEWQGIRLEALRPSYADTCQAASNIASRIKVTVALTWQPMLLTFLNVNQVSASTTAPYLMNTGWDPSSCASSSTPDSPGIPNPANNPVVPGLGGIDYYADIVEMREDVALDE